eukprot:560082-Rhodomonas_salina.1
MRTGDRTMSTGYQRRLTAPSVPGIASRARRSLCPVSTGHGVGSAQYVSTGHRRAISRKGGTWSNERGSPPPSFTRFPTS